MPKNNNHLDNALSKWISQAEDWAHLSHLTTCIWLVIAVMHTGSVNLTKWVTYVPCRGVCAQSIQRRVHRWLYNPRINVHRIYKTLIQAALAGWEEEIVDLALDTSLFWDKYCLVRLCVVYRGRALPVVWRVMKHNSASVAFEDYQEMLRSAVCRLPTGKKVILLADRGFVHPQLMQLLTTELGWSYRIRVKGNTWVWRGKSGWCQLQDVHCHRGEAVCLHNVRIHKGQWYGIVHVIVGRNNVNGEFWGIISDEPTTLHTFIVGAPTIAEYALRFDIAVRARRVPRREKRNKTEENFLDDQSNGWNIQRSEIRSVVALSRLWLILALATLDVTAQGDEVVASGQRRRIDPHWFRGNSYFRIGWEWVKAALLKGKASDFFCRLPQSS